jgi:hypothetical protein
MTGEPILRAVDAAGETSDDPSEDALFMFMEDLEEPGSSFEVERLGGGRERDFIRVTAGDDRTYTLEGPHAEGIGPVRSMRAVHEALTRWAFGLPDWRGPLSGPGEGEPRPCR